MKRVAVLASLVLIVTVPLVAQAPKGWKVRADRSTSASDPDADVFLVQVVVELAAYPRPPQPIRFPDYDRCSNLPLAASTRRE